MWQRLEFLSYHQTFHLAFSTYCKWQAFLSLPLLSPLHQSNFQQSLSCVCCHTGNLLEREEENTKLEVLEEMEINKMDLFSKKKDEILKKAKKITSLCDAEVSIILISSDKLSVYTSPTSTMKKIIDQYQSTVGADLWSSHYEKMQEELRRLKDINTTLTRVTMERKGEEDLDNLNMEQLCNLEDEMILTLHKIRDRKYRLINIQMDVYRKKVRHLECMQYHLQNDMGEYEKQRGGVVDDGGHDSAAAAFAGIIRANSARVQQPRGVPQRDEDENSCVTTEAVEVEDSV